MLRQLFVIVSTLVVLVKPFAIHDVDAINNIGMEVHEAALDPQECRRQIRYILRNNTFMMLQFRDASARRPQSMLLGNTIDLGSYHQCLNIRHEPEHIQPIEGKYCMMRIPFIELSSLTEAESKLAWPDVQLQELYENLNDEKILKDLALIESRKNGLRATMRPSQDSSFSRNETVSFALFFNLAICIPRVCSTKQVLDLTSLNLTSKIRIRESYCRLPDDKPRVAADYVAIAIFSCIGLLTIISTGYDIRHSVLLKKDPKEANKTYMLFSVYTNARNFFTFKANPHAINCVDGIRTFAMLWVILGHSFSNRANLIPLNLTGIFEFASSFSSTWVLAAPITVDTFFTLTGLLLVYTTAHKLSKTSLLKNLHLFYLNRLLRMFPVLATMILLQASFIYRFTDGPVWNNVAQFTNDCRQNWWITLLYVQNFVNPMTTCGPHTWYLAIDMQLYILSPIVLFWMLGGNKKIGWIAVTVAFLAVITGATVYNFIMEFPSITAALGRPQDSETYIIEYYVNTLTRASPFIVGMMFGYAMNINRGKTVLIPKVMVALLWLLAAGVSATVIVSHHYVIQLDWANQTVDSILNSFMRPAWAVCVSWMIFACKYGYGGPIEWFLSLHIFKILGRLSYAMYIIHYPLQNMFLGTSLAPLYFNMEYSLYQYIFDVTVAVVAALLIVVLIDAPFSGIINIFLGGYRGGKKVEDAKKNDDLSRQTDNANEKTSENLTNVVEEENTSDKQ